MEIIKTIIPLLLILLIGIQFFGVTPNTSAIVPESAIENHYSIPSNVQQILKTSCYDCHSNNTVYPSYNKLQPIKWWLAEHIADGKKHLNFDEFNAYASDQKLRKLAEIEETVNAGEMPLKSYTVIDNNAKLSDEQKQQLRDWVIATKKVINRKAINR